VWVQKTFPLPDVVYDRCYYSNRQRYVEHAPAIQRLKKVKSIQFMGYGLKGKWDVQKSLASHDDYLPFLPETDIYTSPQTLLDYLNEEGEAFLKPHAGSHGKGTLYIAQAEPDKYEVRGRDQNNQSFSHLFRQEFALLQWVHRFIGDRKYLVQQYLNLKTTEGSPFDIRSLVQKDGRGLWKMTGMAVRQGRINSITSNLHGGGRAEEVMPFLTRHYGEEKAEQLDAQLHRLSSIIPETLEHHHGRLVELGIDLGVDTSGHIWILEVNSKPGRSVFKAFDHAAARNDSVKLPIQYARYLLDRQLGG
jgi:glutathione synthase/RimK-type ligase-like ATP-grasp enzyme